MIDSPRNMSENKKVGSAIYWLCNRESGSNNSVYHRHPRRGVITFKKPGSGRPSRRSRDKTCARSMNNFTYSNRSQRRIEKEEDEWSSSVQQGARGAQFEHWKSYFFAQQIKRIDYLPEEERFLPPNSFCNGFDTSCTESAARDRHGSVCDLVGKELAQRQRLQKCRSILQIA